MVSQFQVQNQARFRNNTHPSLPPVFARWDVCGSQVKPDTTPRLPLHSIGTPIHTAFEACKALERRGQWFVFDAELGHSESSDILQELTLLVTGRVLGWGLLYPPSDAGRDSLAGDIVACKDNDENLAASAHLCVYALLRVYTSSVVSCPPFH